MIGLQELRNALASGTVNNATGGATLHAVTPHRTYRFGIERVLRDPLTGDTVLELRELDRDDQGEPEPEPGGEDAWEGLPMKGVRR